MTKIYNGFSFLRYTTDKKGNVKTDVLCTFSNDNHGMLGCIGFAQGYFKGREYRPDAQWIMTNASPWTDGWLWWNRHSKEDEKWMVVDCYGRVLSNKTYC